MAKNQHIKSSISTEFIGVLQNNPKYYEKIRTLGKIWEKTQESTIMDKKTICIIPFTGEKEKCHMWSVKFMATAGINRYNFLLTGAKKIPEYEKDIT